MKLILVSIALSVLLISPTGFAHMFAGDFDSVMSQMMVSQGVNSTGSLDCSRISNEEFEQLGDTVMERMLGDHELHEQMDAMMGGEGSASLTQMHIALGKNWLGCPNNFQGMMGGYMMPGMMRMMGNYYPAYYSGYNNLLLFTIIGWVLVVLFGILILTNTIGIKKKR